MIEKLGDLFKNNREIPIKEVCLIECDNNKFYKGVDVEDTDAVINAMINAISDNAKEIKVVYIKSAVDKEMVTESRMKFFKKYLPEETPLVLMDYKNNVKVCMLNEFSKEGTKK